MLMRLRDQGCTILISTHMLEMVKELWDVTFVMDKGRILGTHPRESVAGTVLYLLMFCLVFAAAWRMRCTGDFYEDAVKFSEDYEEVIASRRQGNMDKRLGKKKHFKKADVRWKGGFGDFSPFVIPAVSAYLIFIFTTMNGKWAKGPASPYTYLIPDNPFGKLINATGLQVLQGVINGCLLVLPGAFVMNLSPGGAVLCVVFYAGLYANKLYALAVSEVAVGSTFGRTGKQLVQMLIQSVVILMAVAGAVAGNKLGTTMSAYALMALMLFLCTAILKREASPTVQDAPEVF